MHENTQLTNRANGVTTGPKKSLKGFRREEVRPPVKETLASVSHENPES
jgi:hypothetical protein